MTLASVRVDDIVECEIKGRRFFALVKKKEPGGLKVEPITPNITYRNVTALQVVEHYARRRRRRTG